MTKKKKMEWKWNENSVRPYKVNLWNTNGWIDAWLFSFYCTVYIIDTHTWSAWLWWWQRQQRRWHLRIATANVSFDAVGDNEIWITVWIFSYSLYFCLSSFIVGVILYCIYHSIRHCLRLLIFNRVILYILLIG